MLDDTTMRRFTPDTQRDYIRGLASPCVHSALAARALIKSLWVPRSIDGHLAFARLAIAQSDTSSGGARDHAIPREFCIDLYR